jgi:hypothetical protein
MHALTIADIDHRVTRARRQLRLDPRGQRQRHAHAPNIQDARGINMALRARRSLPTVVVAAATATLLAAIIATAVTIAIAIALALATTVTAASGRTKIRTWWAAKATTTSAAIATSGRAAEAAAAGRTGAIATATAGWTAISTAAGAAWTRTSERSSTATAGTTCLALARFIDPKHATVELLTIELLQRLLSSFCSRHLDECEPSRASCLAVHDDRHARYFAAVCTEGCSE